MAGLWNTFKAIYFGVSTGRFIFRMAVEEFALMAFGLSVDLLYDIMHCNMKI